MNTENDIILKSFQPMLDFLAAAFWPHKAVLYQIDTQLDTGTAILSKYPGIAIGDELGPIGRQVLKNSKKGYHYLIHTGGDECADTREKTSYFIIRNSRQDAIGILMIAYEISYLLQMKKALDQTLGFEEIENRSIEFNDLYHELETEEFSLTRYAAEIISNFIAEPGIPVQRMTMDEKAAILRRLDELEIFNLKGTVKEAATQLMISPATLYRLLKRTD